MPAQFCMHSKCKYAKPKEKSLINLPNAAMHSELQQVKLRTDLTSAEVNERSGGSRFL